MGEYANVKKRNISKFLKWLIKKDDSVSVSTGGKHNIILKHGLFQRPFPIPLIHSEVNRHIVKDLMHVLVENNICTKEEFDSEIK